MMLSESDIESVILTGVLSSFGWTVTQSNN